MSLILERFEAAIETLIGDGPVKQRLTDAYTDYLEDLMHVDLPIADKTQFSDLHSALHSDAAVGEVGCVQVSVRKMSPVEATKHARTILRLYAELLPGQLGPKQRNEPKLRSADETPRYLAASG